MKPFKTHLLKSLAVLLCTTFSAFAAEGPHKLVVLAFGQDEFAIVDLNKDSSKLVSIQERLFPNGQLGTITEKDGMIRLEIKSGMGSSIFEGKSAKDNIIKGSFNFRGNEFPSELVPTKDTKVAELKPGQVMQEFLAALRGNAGNDPKNLAKPLSELIEKYKGKPYASTLYTQYLSLADQLDLSEEQIRSTLDNFMNTAREYGDKIASKAGSDAAKALRGKKKAAAALTDLAQQIEKKLDDEKDLEAKAEIATILAESARSIGKNDLADSAAKRAEALETKLDSTYAQRVPPFKPEKVAAKKDAQPVVFELFTGAQCPPCVAADVAFDALADTYDHANLILLQYHLHIPGPDPLTNADTIARQKYYGNSIQGTPSTFFNGKSQAGGGGSMAMSKDKYDQFRSVIDEQLKEKPKASLNLSATQKGNTIDISVDAKTLAKPSDNSQHKLRLLITEEIVKYIGTNKLRFHHHVVRDMPGGAEGISLDKAGTLTHKSSVDIKKLQQEIEDYVSNFEKGRPFPGTKPNTDLKKLSVVAIIQDDATKEIIGAAQVPVQPAP